MDSLRLILILIGAVIILAVYLHSRFKKASSLKFMADSSALDAALQSSAHATTKDSNSTGAANDASTNVSGERLMDNDKGVIVDPSVYSFDSKQAIHDTLLDDELSELGSQLKIGDSDSVVETHYPSKRTVVGESSESAQSQKQSERKKGELVEKIIVIYLLSQPNRSFSGSEIKNMAESEGLQFGADSYFHRYSNPDEKTGSIFGIANILEPGLFDSIDNEGFSTPGLVFFQQLLNTGNALEEFDELLKSVIQFKEKLDGHLQDSGRHPLNKKAMIKLRDQVSAFAQKNPVSPF